jgi:hypothetical protein
MIMNSKIDLSSLTPDEFADLIRSNLGREADPALWDDLTVPAVISQTRTCLGAIVTDLVLQLQQDNAVTNEFHNECMARGAEGKAEFFAFKAERAEWRRRQAGYRRLVESRLAFVKARIQRPAHTVSPHGAGFTKTARKHNRAALEKLAAAVVEHRHRVTSGEGGVDDDEALWAHLGSVTAINAAGEELPLGEWMEYLEERREDGD